MSGRRFGSLDPAQHARLVGELSLNNAWYGGPEGSQLGSPLPADEREIAFVIGSPDDEDAPRATSFVDVDEAEQFAADLAAAIALVRERIGPIAEVLTDDS